ncbi:MAG: response regulator transcription factor [Frankiales bacterium]|nr:response regulator transcription factor [Frankiales bacterium]
MLRALIVDDDHHMRLLIRLTLETGDAEIGVACEAESGPAALAAIRADRPDVVVLDNMMPGMSGLDVAREVLRDDPDQRIVLFSAALDERTLAQAGALGVRACLHKTSIEQLVETVLEVVAAP